MTPREIKTLLQGPKAITGSQSQVVNQAGLDRELGEPEPSPPFFFLSFFFFFFFGLFRATPMAQGGSQARGPIGAIASSLHHSHSNARSKSNLQPTPIAHGNAGSLTHRVRPGIESTTSWFLVRFTSALP